MTRDRYLGLFSPLPIVVSLGAALTLLSCTVVQAQPTIVSTVPGPNATGVSTTAAVVFTFSEPMDTTATTAQFIQSSPFSLLNTTPSWNASGTVLTCTPNPAFPPSTLLVWAVSGQNPGGDSLGGTASGFFTTGSGGGGTSSGSGTNRITTFTLGKTYNYQQDSASVPTLDTNTPFTFGAVTSLASNRTATAISLKLPGGSVSNLTQNIFEKESFYMIYFTSSSNALEGTFPQGDYSFTVTAAASNQTVTVTLPASMAQPNAPQISNYAEAQAVDASKAFTLKWNAFSTGGSADYISVSVDGSANVWKSPDFAAPGALDGTATSVTIPAGTFAANASYDLSVGFYHATWTSNATYAAGAYRASATRSTLSTSTGVVGPQPVVSNASWNGSSFGFDVTTVVGQKLTIVSSSDCSVPVSSWPILVTTNSPGTVFHFSDSAAGTKAAAYYAVRNGP